MILAHLSRKETRMSHKRKTPIRRATAVRSRTERGHGAAFATGSREVIGLAIADVSHIAAPERSSEAP
ncbi:hypothetical protein WT37_27270 [Burkholderia territorii]|nr:hypothetical protein WT37_27270 [Burkholderia territorii]